MGKAFRYAMPATFKVSCELNDVTVFHVNVSACQSWPLLFSVLFSQKAFCVVRGKQRTIIRRNYVIFKLGHAKTLLCFIQQYCMFLGCRFSEFGKDFKTKTLTCMVHFCHSF